MTGPTCTICDRPIVLVRDRLDRWVWVHRAQPPPSPHRAAHDPVPYTIP